MDPNKVEYIPILTKSVNLTIVTKEMSVKNEEKEKNNNKIVFQNSNLISNPFCQPNRVAELLNQILGSHSKTDNEN